MDYSITLTNAQEALAFRKGVYNVESKTLESMWGDRISVKVHSGKLQKEVFTIKKNTPIELVLRLGMEYQKELSKIISK